MIYRENWEFYCKCNSIKKLTGTIGEIEGEPVGFGVGDFVGCQLVKHSYELLKLKNLNFHT